MSEERIFSARGIPKWSVLSDDFRRRFWKKVIIRGADDCWTWIGHRDREDYGRVMIFAKPYPAHRISFFLYHNGKMNENKLICHDCDNKWCVNPNHLWEGTSKEHGFDHANKNKNRQV